MRVMKVVRMHCQGRFYHLVAAIQIRSPYHSEVAEVVLLRDGASSLRDGLRPVTPRERLHCGELVRYKTQ